MKCPNCGNENPPTAMFCDNCGTSLTGSAAGAGMPPTVPAIGVTPSPVAPVSAVAANICPNCNAAVTPGQAFCEDCGFALGSAPPSPPLPAGAGVPYTPPVPPVSPQPAPPAPTPAMPYPPAPIPQATPVYPQQQYAYAPAMQPAHLVMADGAQIALAGKPAYLLGREDPVSGSFPDVNLDPHGAAPNGVSRQHAKILAQGGYFLVDLNSVNGTFLNKQRLVPNQQMPLNNGDEIRLGKLPMTFHVG